MGNLWTTLATRFAALKRREQILVSFACAAVAYAAIDALLISPALVKRKRLEQEFASKSDQSVKLATQLTILKTQSSQDPDAANRKRLSDVQQQLAELSMKVKEQSTQIVPSDKMPELLQRMLANHPRLEVVEVRTLPQSVIDLGPATSGGAEAAPKLAGASSAPSKPAGEPNQKAPAGRNIYKHGLQISLRGSYLELLAYLRGLEALPARVYMESMELAVEQYPSATLKLRLYTISFDDAWMKV